MRPLWLPVVAVLALAGGGSSAGAATDKAVTFWMPAEVKIDPATSRLATVARSHTSAKMTKACAKNAGKYDMWTVTAMDVASGSTLIVDVAVDKLSGKGLAADLSSLRAEGECTEAGRKWYRFD
ncbi:MAG: hypothetical protein HY694_01890 [Deltaproteobacteria bacterium]|nr:hypothetical protein [Deltaproteobacteria bacterium]